MTADTTLDAGLHTPVQIYEPPAGGLEGPARRRWRRPVLVYMCAAWLTVLIVAAFAADLLPLANPNIDAGQGVRTPPFTVLAEPLGTDGFGRSMLSRLVYGARVSLFATAAAAMIGLATGLLVGVVAGYFRGKVDTVLGVLVDTVLAFPGLVLLMALAAVLDPGVGTVIIGLSIFGWVTFARVSRANTLRVANSEYIAASRGLGAKTPEILIREVLPNVAASVAALAGVVVAALILAEAALSFLGLGVQPPTPSWGNMISEGQSSMRDDSYIVFLPAVVLFFTIFSVNYLGDSLRSRSGAASKL